MEKRKSILNVGISIMFKILLLIMNLVVRRYVIKYLGNEINGLNSLYTSIIGFLSVAELGIGTAITFCMYKPIVENNNGQVVALYKLFVRSYTFIGLFIFVLGSALVPFLSILAKGYEVVEVNLSVTYMLLLVSVVLSYFFSSKTSLINAYKNNYVTTTITSTGILIQGVMQIIVVKYTRSFVAYLVCHIIVVIYQWVLTEVYVRKNFYYIIHGKGKLEKYVKENVLKNIKALFLHKIGAILVNTVDSAIISAFIGVAVLGKYTNYTVLITAITGLLALFFTPLTSIIGHLYVSNREKTYECFCLFHSFNFIIGFVCLLGYYAIIDNMINVLFGKGLLLGDKVAFVVTINYYVQFMRNSTMVFKDATGTFYYDRWKPVAEGISNLCLSLCFVNVFPEKFAVLGVIVATILTNLCICHIVEPYVLIKHGFGKNVKRFLIKNYFYMLWFIGAMLIMNKIKVTGTNQFIDIIINGALSFIVSVLGVAFVLIFDIRFKESLKRFIFKTNDKPKLFTE